MSSMKSASMIAKRRAVAKSYSKKKALQKKPIIRYYQRPFIYRSIKANPVQDSDTIGQKIGSNVGRFVGGALQKVVERVTGFGDYRIEHNSIMHGMLTPPEVANTIDNGGFIVRHREYIGDVLATTAFTNTTYAINPGLVNSFPWLSQVAIGFEQYRLRGLIYEFKSMSSDAVLSSATSSALGTVIMATDYDSLDSKFVDKKTMENYQFANSDKPSCSFYHPIECKRLQTSIDVLYVRSGAVPALADQRLYDLGNFQIATQGMQAASGVAGELWCTYEIEFYKPKLLSAVGYELQTDKFECIGVSAVAPFGTSRSLQLGSNIGTFVTSTTIALPPNVSSGIYMIAYYCKGTNAVIANPTWTVINGTKLTVWANQTLTVGQGPADGTSNPNIMNLVWIQVTGQLCTIQCGTGGTFPGSVTSCELVVTQVNGNIQT